MNVDPRKSGASVNGKELKNDEMQHIMSQNDFFINAFFLNYLRSKS